MDEPADSAGGATSAGPVGIERDGPVWTVILDRPQRRNAVDGPTAAALADAMREFDASADAAIAVLWGAGGTFCSGADLHELTNSLDVEMSADAPMGVSRLQLGKPVIAAVSGYAVAGGLEIALWCDLRVVERDALFGVLCRRWGVPLIDGGTVRLPQLVGLGRALDLILTGRLVTADEALAIGLATRVVEPGSSRQEAEQLAHQLAAFPQACMRSDRNSVYRGLGLDAAAAMEQEFAAGLRSLSAEGRAGAARFAAGAGRHGDFGAGAGRDVDFATDAGSRTVAEGADQASDATGVEA